MIGGCIMIKRQITADDALGDISACSANDMFFLHDFLERVVDIFDSPTPPEFTLANFCVKKSGRHKSSTGLALQSIIRHIFYLKSKELAEMRDFIWEEISQRMNGPDALANTSDKLYALSFLAHFQARHPDTSDIDVNKVRAMILANEVHSEERTLPVEHETFQQQSPIASSIGKERSPPGEGADQLSRQQNFPLASRLAETVVNQEGQAQAAE
jgi:hypothetical protein